MVNLLEQTIAAVENAGKTPADIVFIGTLSPAESCSWEDFKLLADFEYDNGYGGAEISTGLIIVFSDGSRLFRGEYDGSEWWNFMPKFKKPRNTAPLKDLRKGGGL